MYHPDCTLRLSHFEGRLGYDGSVRLTTYAHVIAPDGTATEHRSQYTHRLPPNAWHGATLPEAVRDAFTAHHAFLGLREPEPLSETHPLHLHPQGYPGTAGFAAVPQPPVTPEVDDHRAKVAAFLVRTTEQGLMQDADHRLPVVIPPEHYPLAPDGGVSALPLPSTPPPPPAIDVVPRAAPRLSTPRLEGV